MRIAVIGGGMAGLACTDALVAQGAEVTLFESGDRFGGQVRTTRDRGYLVEEGADAIGPNHGVAAARARAMGLGDQLVEHHALPTLRLLNGALDPLPNDDAATLLGIQDPRTPGRPPVTLASGMDSLVLASTARLREAADLRRGTSVVALDRTPDHWIVNLAMGSALQVDALVLAIPPKTAAWLVHPTAPSGGRFLASLGARPAVVVSLGFQRDALTHPLDANGFSVPLESLESGVQSCAFVSSYISGRAPDGCVLLRILMRPGRRELDRATDAVWVDRTLESITPVLGIRGVPDAYWVARWPEVVPTFSDRYRGAVAAGREALRKVGLVELAGSAYDGPGIDAAISSGVAAAAALGSLVRR
ncbi:MAG TPA: FAD-dependent oxidoreductase [Gemmatimonadales bacterium]